MSELGEKYWNIEFDIPIKLTGAAETKSEESS
jgi:hypothetical protein